MNLSVLVVEDEAVHALTLKRSLEELGHHVLGLAGDGRQACRLRRELNPDLVLMDIRLPEMDGFKAASVMNREGPLPVVLVTAYADREFLRRAREAQVYSYLVKPVETAVLGPAIELAYTNFQRLRQLERQVTDLRDELRARKVIERAKGLVMERRKLTEAQAMTNLERESAERGLTLLQLAEEIVAPQGS